MISSRHSKAIYYCYRRTEDHSRVGDDGSEGANVTSATDNVESKPAKEPLPWTVFKVPWHDENSDGTNQAQGLGEIEVLTWSKALNTGTRGFL